MAIAHSYRYLNPESSVRDAVQDLRVPTMLAYGHYEKRFAPLRDYAADAIPGLRVVEMEAGHPVNIQAADAFNREVEVFFRKYLAT